MRARSLVRSVLVIDRFHPSVHCCGSHPPRHAPDRRSGSTSLAEGADVSAIAAASADAAERDLRRAADDPTLQHVVYLLAQLPLAARDPDFSNRLRGLGLETSDHPELFELLGAYTMAVDAHSDSVRSKSDLGEMAVLAASESLAAVVGAALPGLFDQPRATCGKPLPGWPPARISAFSHGTFSVASREDASSIT